MKKTNTSTHLKMKYIWIILMTFAVLVGMRWFWTHQMFPVLRDHSPVNGELDLRNVDLDSAPLMYLNGEWDFYPHQLLTLQEIRSGKYDSIPIQVPGDWGDALNNSDNTSYGYGTYRLQIRMNPIPQPVSFWFKKLQASSEVEINGETVSALGTIGDIPEQYKPNSLSFTPSYDGNTTKIDLVVRIANFDSPHKGGIMVPAYFGSQAAMDFSRWYSIGFQLFIFLVLMLHGIYAGILFLINPCEKSLLYALLVTVSVGIAILSAYDNILMLWLPLNYTWGLKVHLIALLALSMFIILLFRKFTTRRSPSRWTRIYLAMLLAMMILTTVSPASFIYEIIHYRIFDWLYCTAFVWFITLSVKMVGQQQNDQDIIFILVSASCIISNLLWSFAELSFNVTTVFYPFDLIMALAGFSTYWFKKYFRNARLNVELNEQLIKADRIKDQFLANTSHELRTPLHGIMNIAHNVVSQEKGRLHPGSLQDMNLLITISRRMSHLIGDLLDVVRLKEHRIKLHPEPIRVQSIVPGVLSMLQFMTERKTITLHNDIPDSLPAVMADEKRLVQILHNLIHNALKFTETGMVTLSAEVRETKAIIHVSDTGIGMDKETLSRVFSPYEQGLSGDGHEQGIGLGLSICQQLVELHGGTLSARSEPSKGSTFTFSLPLANTDLSQVRPGIRMEPWEEAASPSTKLSAAAKSGSETNVAEWSEQNTKAAHASPAVLPLLQESPIHILAVDDDPINLKVLVSMLSSEPYTVTTAHSAREALELLDTRQWDLLVTDVMMPQMSGYELTQRVRERYSVSELPILLLTARSQPSDIYTGFSSGANDYVTKPVDALELKYRIKALIGLKQSINERLRIEAAYLQAQIQPHFLFNTLNSLIALSDIDTEKMHKFGDAFASFLRISFNYLNTGKLVELPHELELVQAYLYIEQERFGERLSIILNIEPGLNIMLPPLSVQPLVENAVQHGLLGRASGGTLTLTIAREKQSQAVRVEVHDNGVGMDSQLVKQLLDVSMQGKQGIGVANTNRRLIQLYGQGLTIRSEPGAGTSVSFVIPYQQPESHEHARS
ncbi:ATP-binding protein [Paenibacillus sp. FSL W8-0426]|uniref:hybrid sensor histidine kinase/response regulator n=1 Tax=Paenibacillus sp. FSL W8-0426 TaxID=2921714 RepID=UPI0030DB8656